MSDSVAIGKNSDWLRQCIVVVSEIFGISNRPSGFEGRKNSLLSGIPLISVGGFLSGRYAGTVGFGEGVRAGARSRN